MIVWRNYPRSPLVFFFRSALPIVLRIAESVARVNLFVPGHFRSLTLDEGISRALTQRRFVPTLTTASGSLYPESHTACGAPQRAQSDCLHRRATYYPPNNPAVQAGRTLVVTGSTTHPWIGCSGVRKSF